MYFIQSEIRNHVADYYSYQGRKCIYECVIAHLTTTSHHLDKAYYYLFPRHITSYHQRSNIKMARNMLLLTVSLSSYLSLSIANPLVARDHVIQRFEERFINTLTWEHPNSTVKLVGYKKIIMTPTQLQDLELNIASQPNEWDAFINSFYDPHEKTMRVYFPVEGALLYHDNDLIEVSDLGEHPHHETINGDYAVVGRYKTDKVHGTTANRVEDGIVWLHEPAVPVRMYGEKSNVMMYDFGWRAGAHAHDHGDLKGRSEGEGGSCKQNHGGRVCSLVYNINHGRCPRDYSGCIDYNGWPKKNCNNHSDKWAFPGSDCFTSVARGHCWNEIDRAL